MTAEFEYWISEIPNPPVGKILKIEIEVTPNEFMDVQKVLKKESDAYYAINNQHTNRQSSITNPDRIEVNFKVKKI